ncbi:anhydro-N-acetylmuramic acid kinase [Nitratireductor mangrovi]|uniref:Anhydro-N-acetylmuramic acid kinase n=1 Tax=Nitratireductor mangrovi TaxID=2599600 RepID=A0A5B8KYZ0_9HYPH|nr:anhydro-N-acetylmuramic acid kinase [Nitratireductor mangrovi]QDZ00809.1 anhydro-N-acetylmuramic acid kinase [Nitratireductor mangrovi]
MSVKCAIGLMSGTSMDGIDLALLDTDGDMVVRRGPAFFVPYEAAFRRRIESALDTAKGIEHREQRPGDLGDLEREITLRHADAVARFRAEHPRWAGRVELVGFHGQTVLHRPKKSLTVQLGDGPLLARETGLAVVFDLRANDMRHGGQGAPLVPAYHTALAHALVDAGASQFPICFVNVGGISNITWVPARGDPVAFDSGPGNALIDQWVAGQGGIPFDADGMIASEGGVVASVVARYLENPFFARKGPKSLDRGDFTLEPAEGLELADGARTLANVSAEAILKAAEQMPELPKCWIICGGGRKNPHIVADLRRGADAMGSAVALAEDVGLDGDAMEAEAWAYLAVRSLAGLPVTFPTTTGCHRPVTGGVIVSPPRGQSSSALPHDFV